MTRMPQLTSNNQSTYPRRTTAVNPATSARATYLFVLPWEPHHVGGVSTVVNGLARAMKASGSFSPKVSVNRYENDATSRKQDYVAFDFSILLATTIPGLIKACVKAPVQLWRTLRLLRADNVRVVNFHYPGLAPLGIAILKRLGLYQGRLLLSYHGTDVAPPRGLIDRVARRLIYSAADCLVACSNSLATRMVSEFVVPASRVAVIFNGVDESFFRGPRGTATPNFTALPEWFIVNVGSYIPRKNHLFLIEAFAQLAARYPDLHLCIVGGDGPERANLRTAVENRGLAARVRLFVDLDQNDVAFLLARATVCVQTSLAESFPLALLEAAASGTPVVASNIPGHDELIRENVTGRLFPLGDVDACATAIASVLDDPGSASVMATAQRARVQEKFTLVSCLREYEKLAVQR